jgi:hypothetical protein
MRRFLMAVAGSTFLLATPALADGVGMTAGMAGGAAAGAVIGGPVGAAIGGAAGGIIGAGLPPRAVVVEQGGPSVVYDRGNPIVVGQPLPQPIEVRPIPQYTTYSYAIVNGRHVVVDAGSRRVVQVLD